MRTRALFLAALLSAGQAWAQTYGYATTFDGFADQTTAESLTLTGVTFSSSPAGTWGIVTIPPADNGETIFNRIAGKALASSLGSPLDITFSAPVARFAMDFGVLGGPAAAESLTVEGLAGTVSVGKTTAVAAPVLQAQGVVVTREGAVLLDPGKSFGRVRLTWSAPPSGSLAVLDNLKAIGSRDCGNPLPAPVLSPLLPQVSAGQRAGLSVAISQELALVSKGTYIVEGSRDPSFAHIDTLATVDFTATGLDDPALAQLPIPPSGSDYSFYVRARASTRGCPAGPNSAVATLAVKGNPAEFVIIGSGPSWVVGLGDGVAPPSGTVTVRNSGSLPGRITFSAVGTFFTFAPAQLDVAAGAQGTVTLTATAAAAAAAGYSGGALLGTYAGDRLVVPVSLTVVPGSAKPGSRAGTKAAASVSRVTFVAPAGQNPEPQKVTIAVGPVTGTGPVFLHPTIGPDASWLSVTGFGVAAPSSGTANLTFSVDRSKRTRGGTSLLHRALVTVGAVGATTDDAAVIEVLDVEPITVTTGAGADRLVKPNAPAFVVPTTVKGGGLYGASFDSDGWLRNEVGANVAADLYFTPDGLDGVRDPAVRKASVVLPASSTLRLRDLLQTVFQTSGTGQVELRSSGAGFLTLRTRVEATTAGDRTARYGTEIPTFARNAGVKAGQGELLLPGISEDAKNRTNLILTETTGAPATALVTAYDATGALVGSKSFDVPPLSKVQVSRVVDALASGQTVTRGSLAVSVTSGAGAVVPLATVIDNRSNAFSAVLGRAPRARPAQRTAEDGPAATDGAGYLVLPSAARLTGALNTSYVTSLSLVNGTASPANLTLTYLYTDVDDGQAKSSVKTLTLPPRGALGNDVAEDVLAAFFGVTDRSYGWIKIEGDIDHVVASAAVSTQVDPADSSKGLKTASVDAVLADAPEVMAQNESERLYAGAEKSVESRTNLVLEEVTGQDAQVTVRLFTASGDLLGQMPFSVAANQYLQLTDVFSVFGLGDGPYQDVQVTAQVVGGSGRVVAFASVIDNASKNPEIYLLREAGPSSSTLGF